MLIEIQGVCKSFAGRPVLENVCLQIARGDTVVLAGPSGAGKTTLLRCLNGLERADTGLISVAGQELEPGGMMGESPTAVARRERRLIELRRRVGFVFQQWQLFANLTVLDNVAVAPIEVRRLSRAAATARARLLLEQVGIAHRSAAFPNELSGGEQQRAAIARALAMEPEVLLLDEPTSALDATRTDELLRLLRSLPTSDGGKLTLVAVSHDARVPAGLGGRLVSMEGGRIVGDSGVPVTATTPA